MVLVVTQQQISKLHNPGTARPLRHGRHAPCTSCCSHGWAPWNTPCCSLQQRVRHQLSAAEFSGWTDRAPLLSGTIKHYHHHDKNEVRDAPSCSLETLYRLDSMAKCTRGLISCCFVLFWCCMCVSYRTTPRGREHSPMAGWRRQVEGKRQLDKQDPLV